MTDEERSAQLTEIEGELRELAANMSIDADHMAVLLADLKKRTARIKRSLRAEAAYRAS